MSRNIIQQIVIFSSLAAIALFLPSCKDKYVYQESHEIPATGWAYADTVNFAIPISDTSALYNLYIDFKHAESYPNQNIYLKLYTKFPSGKRVGRVRSFEFFDLEGKPLGKCSGKTCENRILLQDNLYFNQIGDYIITLEQFTRRDPMPDISQVGLMLEKTDKKR